MPNQNTSDWGKYEHMFQTHSLEEIAQAAHKTLNAVKKKAKALEEQGVKIRSGTLPKGGPFKPGLEWNGNSGTITTDPQETPPEAQDWDPYLRIWNLDPEKFKVIEPVQFRAWDANTQEGIKRLYYYRITVERRINEQETDEVFEDIDALLERTRDWSSVNPVKRLRGDANPTIVVAIADTQIGKDEGGGTESTVQRVEQGLANTYEYIKELRLQRLGEYNIDLVLLGDLFENCANFYPQQQFRVDRTRRDQAKILRRVLLEDAIKPLRELTPRLRVSTVGGNHGENRNNGNSFTDFSDNDDVAVVEQVAMVVENSDKITNVEFVIPYNELSVVVNMSGVDVALAHGHQFKGSGNAMQKAAKWWAGQAHGLQPAGRATILLSGHYHHLTVNHEGAKTHIQMPALDGGSEHFTNETGQSSPAGLMTLIVDQRIPDGWTDLKDMLKYGIV